jgi:hypothetical protein
MRRFMWPTVALALVILYPVVFTTPFQQRLGALILLYAIAASAWNIIGGYAGQVSGRTRGVLQLRLCRDGRIRISRCRRWLAFPQASPPAC